MRRKIIISLSFLALAVVLSVAAAAAWFAPAKYLFDLKFTAAEMDVNYSVFKAQDYDGDGLPDLDGDGGEIFLPQRLAYKQDGEQSNAPIDIDGLFTSSAVTIKVTVDGLNEAVGSVAFTFPAANENMPGAETVSVSVYYRTVNYNEDGTAVYGEKTSADITSLDGQTFREFFFGLNTSAATQKMPLKGESAEIFFTFKCNTEKTLAENGIAYSQPASGFTLSGLKMTVYSV